MQHSLSELLLLENELYLEAVQHRHISLQTLGLHEVRYDFNTVRNKSGKKQLRAVIPEDNQRQFLQKTGMLPETIPTIPEENVKSKQRIRYRKRRAELEQAHHNDKNKQKGKPAAPESEAAFVSHPARRTSIGGTPLYTKPSKTHTELLEREREDAIARNKDKEWQKKLGTSFDIVGPDGVKYVYDNRGFKVTEEQYQKQLDDAEREKKRLSHEKIVEPHGVEIIEKTRRFVEELRKRVEMETVIDYRWYPGKFPATTIPPRAQSAGALGRSQSSQHGTVRDFSSLGKSTRSPFRNGETPVLPMNLVCRWPEYRVMEEGDVVLTVEHCCNCAEHELITHHKEEQYVQLAEHVRDALSATAVKFAVRFYSVLKPIEHEDPLAKSLSLSERASSAKLLATGRTPPPSQHQCSTHKHLHDTSAFSIDYSKRMGAFEVQVAIKTRKDLICHLLFSKLFRGVWPSIPALQHLLERLLTEAKFTRLAPEEDHVHRSPKSKRNGSPGKKTRRRSEESEPEIPELHAAFDQREPPQTDSEPMSAARSRAISSEEAAGTVTVLASVPTVTMSAEPASETATGDSEATLQRRPVQRPAPSSFSSEGEPETLGFSPVNSLKFGSTKATMLALGAATNGLNMMRAARQQESSAPTKISLEQAAQIAAQSIVKGFGAHKAESADGDQAPPGHADLTKKGSAIGVLSRQNAGGGRGSKFLHIDEEANQELEPEEHVQTHHPELTIQTSTSARSPSVRSAPFTPKLPPVKMSDNEENDEEPPPPLDMSSPSSSSSKSIAPVATVVQLTTTGLNIVRQRAASISDVPAAASVIEKLHTLALKGKVTQSEKIQSKVPAPKLQPRSAHPSMEMRSRLDIGQLSRQNAGKVLVVPGDDSDEDAAADAEADSAPVGMFANAMSAAVKAVNLAMEASAKRTLTAEDTNMASSQATPTSAASHSPGPAQQSANDSRASQAATPARISASNSPATTPAAGTPSAPAASASVPVPAPIRIPSPAPAPVPPAAVPSQANTVAAGATSPAVPEPAPAHAPAASPSPPPLTGAASSDSAAAPAKMTTAEVLQHKRLLADKLLLDMGDEYGEDFEEFSPTTRRAADGYEDLFEASEFRLDDEDAAALA